VAPVGACLERALFLLAARASLSLSWRADDVLNQVNDGQEPLSREQQEGKEEKKGGKSGISRGLGESGMLAAPKCLPLVSRQQGAAWGPLPPARLSRPRLSRSLASLAPVGLA